MRLLRAAKKCCGVVVVSVAGVTACAPTVLESEQGGAGGSSSAAQAGTGASAGIGGGVGTGGETHWAGAAGRVEHEIGGASGAGGDGGAGAKDCGVMATADNSGGANANGATPQQCSSKPRGEALHLLIDDFERADAAILSVGQRRGNWRHWLDASPDNSFWPETLLPSKTGSTCVDGALHLVGRNFGQPLPGKDHAGFGAVIIAELNAGCVYDASNYAGVSFKLRGRSSQPLFFQVAVPEVLPPEEGGSCNFNPDCFNKHHVEISNTELHPDTYKTFEVRWEQLQQGVWGLQVDFSPVNIRSVEFAFPQFETKDPAPELVNFDVWIDDLQFIKK